MRTVEFDSFFGNGRNFLFFTLLSFAFLLLLHPKTNKKILMSDGNFNRALLPHTPYASGLKMGQTMMRAKMKQAFLKWLREDRPELTDEEAEEKLLAFKRLLY